MLYINLVLGMKINRGYEPIYLAPGSPQNDNPAGRRPFWVRQVDKCADPRFVSTPKIRYDKKCVIKVLQVY